MKKLTEEMVIARAKISDMSKVKRLNCWGSELVDVSLLRRMPNVEVLSLSINKIKSLSDIGECLKLQELYVRQNAIEDLNEVMHLQDLKHLRQLWLAENPCAASPSYRLTVLRALPHLETLDGVSVQPHELQDAKRHGRVLVHPYNNDDDDVGTIAATAASEDVYYYDDEKEEDNNYIDVDADADVVIDTDTHLNNVQLKQHQKYKQEFDEVQEDTSEYYEEDDQKIFKSPSIVNSPTRRSSSEPQRSFSPSSEQDNSVYYEDRRNINQNYYEDYTNGNGHYQKQQQQQPQQRYCEKNKNTCSSAIHRASFNRRPVTRNSNILSAVLCLVKELDYPSLEVVEMAVRCRMDELEELTAN